MNLSFQDSQVGHPLLETAEILGMGQIGASSGCLDRNTRRTRVDEHVLSGL